MPRSAGVTVSAVVVIVGSAFTILCGAMLLIGALFVSKFAPAANVPASLGVIVVIEAVMFFGFGGWGLGSGIGLIGLRQWARISLLVFAALLVLCSLPAAVMMAVIPLPAINDANVPTNFMSIMRIGTVLFYATFAALGGLWLYFFNRKSVKAQFQSRRGAAETPAAQLPLGTPVAAHTASQRTRPVSITIIGWFMIVGSVLAPLTLLFDSAFFPAMQIPVYFLGLYFSGRSAYLVFVVWMAAQMAAGVGLLKLKNWGLFAAIGLQCLAVANLALLIGIPGSRARFQQIMNTMMASMNPRIPHTTPFAFPVWIGLASSIPILFVILWFLITRRHAFASAAPN
jgi:hypothetical protein